ncbi:hypothetical protein ARNL5_02606 [Anaerolineae bacterium]|nr:hypothetical protein ARNL5_02606 [Anaerolineae bacterium]
MRIHFSRCVAFLKRNQSATHSAVRNVAKAIRFVWQLLNGISHITHSGCGHGPKALVLQQKLHLPLLPVKVILMCLMCVEISGRYLQSKLFQAAQ